MQKYPVLESQFLKWFHCIGMNCCHCLSNCDCVMLSTLPMPLLGGYIGYVIAFSLRVAELLSAFLCLRTIVQIPWLSYACSCT